MATKSDLIADLQRLLNNLPESELHAVKRFAEYLRDQADPLLQTLANAPLDDEPETEEERIAVAEALEDMAAGRLISHEEVRRHLSEQT